MKHFDDDSITKKPIVPSSLTAEKELRSWLKANDLTSMIDHGGQAWCLNVKGQQGIDPVEGHSLWSVEALLFTSIDRAQLLDTGVLTDKDSRLVNLIGEDSISLRLKPLIYSDRNFESVRSWLRNTVEALRLKLNSPTIRTVKLKLVHEWVDRKMRFNQRV